MSSAEEVLGSKEKIEAKNTSRSTMWAVCAFNSWVSEHNERVERPEDKCPYDVVLCTDDMKHLCDWLCVFMKEARRENREAYTPRSISMLLSGLQRWHNSKLEPHETPVKLVDPINPVFNPSRALGHYN